MPAKILYVDLSIAAEPGNQAKSATCLDAIMKPRVSVILPTYNRLPSLSNSVSSVLTQSYQNFELIVVDDASTQDVRSIIESFGDARVNLIRRQRNAGASAARNTGLQHAQGEYIAFQDSDDLWLPDKLKSQVELLDSLPEDFGVVTAAKILYGRDSAWKYGPGRVTIAPPAKGLLKDGEDQVRRFLCENRISLQNALFRRSCMPGSIWFDELAKANADWEFTIRLVQNTRVWEDADPVVLSFISPDSISRNSRKKALGLLRIHKKNRLVFERYPDEYGQFLYTLSQQLWACGRRSSALAIFWRSALLRPAGISHAAGALFRRFLG